MIWSQIRVHRYFLLSAIGNGQEAGSVDVRVKCGSAETADTSAQYRGRCVTESPRRTRAIRFTFTHSSTDLASRYHNHRDAEYVQRGLLTREMARARQYCPEYVRKVQILQRTLFDSIRSLERLQSGETLETWLASKRSLLATPVIFVIPLWPRRSSLTFSILQLDGITIAVITVIAIACLVSGKTISP